MRIEIARAFVPVEVDLWGEVFQTIDVPRSGAKKAAEIMERVYAVEDGDEDKGVDAIAELVDLKLVSPNGKKTKPSTLIKRKWRADELTFRQLMGFITDLQGAEVQIASEGRPT